MENLKKIKVNIEKYLQKKSSREVGFDVER